jgi:hypothetical protein
MRSYLYLDTETYPLENASQFIEPPEPDARLTDPVKKAADIEKKTAALHEKCSTDWNVCRIVSLAYAWDDGPIEVELLPQEDDESEAMVLSAFWAEVSSRHISDRVLCGFCIRTFDLPLLIQRSRYLSVKPPPISLARFRRDPIFDLYDELTFDQVRLDKGVMRQSLKAFARRFGIPVPDQTDGADIAGLVQANNWDAVRAHNVADLELTRELAKRVGACANREVASVRQ